MIGLSRTFQTEQTINFITLDLNRFETAGWDAVPTALRSFSCQLAPDDETNPMME